MNTTITPLLDRVNPEILEELLQHVCLQTGEGDPQIAVRKFLPFCISDGIIRFRFSFTQKELSTLVGVSEKERMYLSHHLVHSVILCGNHWFPRTKDRTSENLCNLAKEHSFYSPGIGTSRLIVSALQNKIAKGYFSSLSLRYILMMHNPYILDPLNPQVLSFNFYHHSRGNIETRTAPCSEKTRYYPDGGFLFLEGVPQHVREDY